MDTYTELFEKLVRLQWLLQRQRMQGHAGRGPCADPTRGQGRVLAMLKLQPEISTKDLSYLLGIRQQSLNELLNKMEKSGYVERVPSEADRRVMMVRLTEKGRAEEQADTDSPGIFNCLSHEEQEAFGNYLDRIIAALEEQIGAEPDKEEWEGWIQTARSRMGEEQFERLMAMRCGPDGQGGRFGRDMGGFGRDRHPGHPHVRRKDAPRRPRDQHPDDHDSPPDETDKPHDGQ